MKTIETIAELLKKLKTAEAEADKNISDWPRETRPGLEIRKAQAIRELPNLRREYLTALTTRIAKILVCGKTSVEEFSKQMIREKAFVYSANALYKYLATNLESLVSYGGSFTPAAYLQLVEDLGALTFVYRLETLPLVQAPNSPVRDFNELADVVKSIVREAYGDSLNKAFLTEAFTIEALSRSYDKEVVLFTIVDLSNEEREYLTSGFFPNQPSFAVDLTETDTPDTIKSFTAKLYSQIYRSFRTLGKVD